MGSHMIPRHRCGCIPLKLINCLLKERTRRIHRFGPSLANSCGKLKCYRCLVNHLKVCLIELLKNAAQHAAAEVERVPYAPYSCNTTFSGSSKKAGASHMLHQPWCESCVCFRARLDRQCRDDNTRVSGTPTVLFDLAFARSIPEGTNPQEVAALPFLVMHNSSTGYVGCVPLRSKGQLELMTREILAFTAGLGYLEVIYRCDNEPTMRQLLKYVVPTRLSMGLPARSVLDDYVHWHAS